MCDTMVVLAAASASGCTILAKNSDREPNEAQHLFQAPAAIHPSGAVLRCTSIDIPQAPRTCALLGSQPWWTCGFEHGVNERGLAIGNEAVWSRIPAGRKPGPLGMDLLRLGLEHAATAAEALSVITGLLERHGQSVAVPMAATCSTTTASSWPTPSKPGCCRPPPLSRMPAPRPETRPE